mmetsp:Transcript_39349/g.80605  ORF Transcript_39349/g.80605 Transcript_39349/m.80605 type:complete len:81 (+) Transcript_39349:412-654(+)
MALFSKPDFKKKGTGLSRCSWNRFNVKCFLNFVPEMVKSFFHRNLPCVYPVPIEKNDFGVELNQIVLFLEFPIFEKVSKN